MRCWILFVDARMEGCKRMATNHGWLQRRSGWRLFFDGKRGVGGGVGEEKLERVDEGEAREDEV